MTTKQARNKKFLNPRNWSEIKRGWIFEAVVPYTPERPLEFFVRDEKDSLRGQVLQNNGNFRAGSVPEIVMKLKTRKVLILSNDDLAQNSGIYEVTVAPIYSIYPDHHQLFWYQELLAGDHEFFVHVPEEVTGRECLIDLSNVISLNKNMLLEEKYDIRNRMCEVEDRLEYCLKLGLYREVVSADQIVKK